MDDKSNILNSNDTFAISKLSSYQYKIDIPEEEPVIIQIDETTNLQLIEPPIYTIIINGYTVRNQVTKNDVPARFLYVIDLIDYYIKSRNKDLKQ